MITQHEIYRRIDPDNATRRQGYRALFEVAFDHDEVREIRKAETFSMPLGTSRFAEQIEAALDRSTRYPKRGRAKQTCAS